MKNEYATQLFFQDLALDLKKRLERFDGGNTEEEALESGKLILFIKNVLYDNGGRVLELSLARGNEFLRDFDQYSYKIYEIQLDYIVKSIKHAAKGQPVYWFELPKELRCIRKPEKAKEIQFHHRPVEVARPKKVKVPANRTLAVAANS